MRFEVGSGHNPAGCLCNFVSGDVRPTPKTLDAGLSRRMIDHCVMNLFDLVLRHVLCNSRIGTELRRGGGSVETIVPGFSEHICTQMHFAIHESWLAASVDPHRSASRFAMKRRLKC